MSPEITRGYLRTRITIVLIGFFLALAAGGGYINWQSETEKNKVRFGAVISTMAEATSDLVLILAQLENTAQLSEAEKSLFKALAAQNPAPAANERPASRSKDYEQQIIGLKQRLSNAVERARQSYQTLEWAADGDIVMSESARISSTEGDGHAAGITDETAMFKRNSMPASVRKIWEGDEAGSGIRNWKAGAQETSLRDDIQEFVGLASRLDTMQAYSGRAPKRIFGQVNEIATTRIAPTLASVTTTLQDETINSYGVLQHVLMITGALVIFVGILIGGFVFMPMERNISETQKKLKEAHEETRTALEKAESADRSKSEFLANMSHEIRTPMNGVLGMAELLARSDLDSRQSTFVDVIVKSGNALLTIINDILDFSKIDAGRLELDPAPAHLGEAVEDVATLVSSSVAEKDMELIVRIAPDLPQVVNVDIGRFRQVITNLVGNAVKFTDSGHVLVDVSGEAEDRIVHLTVRVEDTGIGIPEEKLLSVFEKFAQVDASSTRRHEGTGLGLAIASRLIRLMGGEIQAKSVVGKGTVFWFTVPLEIVEDFNPRKTAPLDVSGSRILIIDDNPVNRNILVEQLRSWNFDCAAAESGKVGLAVVKRSYELPVPIDCIILDYQMPGMNGEDVAREIRANPAHAGIPIVLLTSVDQGEFRHLTDEYGIAAYLTKPARSSLLLETIVSVLHHTKGEPEKAGAAPLAEMAKRMRSLQLRSQPPHKAADPENEKTLQPRLEHKNAVPLEILVAEDNEVNQMVFSQILDELDVSYKIVGNGKKAVDVHRAMSPKIILMDVSMPEMNGLEATKAIREVERATGHHTPIIGVTAHALKGDKERCLEAGMDDYLSKPVSPDKLAEIASRWLNKAAA